MLLFNWIQKRMTPTLADMLRLFQQRFGVRPDDIPKADSAGARRFLQELRHIRRWPDDEIMRSLPDVLAFLLVAAERSREYVYNIAYIIEFLDAEFRGGLSDKVLRTTLGDEHAEKQMREAAVLAQERMPLWNRFSPELADTIVKWLEFVRDHGLCESFDLEQLEAARHFWSLRVQ
jgi:hypothetical protein